MLRCPNASTNPTKQHQGEPNVFQRTRSKGPQRPTNRKCVYRCRAKGKDRSQLVNIGFFGRIGALRGHMMVAKLNIVSPINVNGSAF